MTGMSENECARFLEDLELGSEDALQRARLHAAGCAACAEELAAFDEVSRWARGRRQEWASPGMWTRIESSLVAEQRKRRPFVMPARAWLAVAAMLLLAVPAAWWVRQRQTGDRLSQEFLTSQTLKQVEDARAAYVRSIDDLDRLAQPALNNDNLRAMAAYRDKLLLLDKAIAEARDAASGNRLNAQVQAQLASLLQEKQRTLEEVLNYAKSNQNRL